MWVPTGKDSFLADQEKLKQAEEELRREKNRIIQIERSPAERDRSVYRPPTPEGGKEVSKRVIRRRDSTPTLSPSPTKHDRDHRRSTTRRRSSPSPSRRDRRRSKDVPDYLSSGDSISRERERIAKEKEELMRKLDSNVALSHGISLPQPVSSSSQGLPEPVRSRRDRDDRRDSRGGGDSGTRGPSNNSDAARVKGEGGGGIQFTIGKRLIGGQWAVESDSEEEEDEDKKRNRRTWKDEKKDLEDQLNRIKSRVPREVAKKEAKKILPGASSIEDIERRVSAAKKEKMEKLKQHKLTHNRW